MKPTHQDLLLEIGCEELPTQAVRVLKDRLATVLKEHLANTNLLQEDTQITTFASPRRIAVHFSEIATMQPSQKIERQGPSYAVAYDQTGKPTPAALKFAEACGTSLEALSVKETPKGKFLQFLGKLPARPTLEILPALIANALLKLPIDRPMRWGEYKESFARPVHWILLLFGEQVIEAEFFNVKSSDKTYGHRFHSPQAIVIENAKVYREKLLQAKVIANFEERREQIQQKMKAALAETDQIELDADLLDEITSLIEWPVVLMGEFNPDYLKIPPEVLITSMKTNQKYFPIFDQNGKLQPRFILVSNIESKQPQAVIKGNERVLNARLADAEFFYKNDLQHSLESRLPHLEHIIFQKQLGSIAHKTERMVNLAAFIAEQIGADVKVAKQAAQLCKSDLLSEMVGEFPNLQGIMGYYYAQNDGLGTVCALAIKEHYYPRFAGDVLPSSLEGVAVALADKIDSLIGIFGIHQAPTGDKDPFALRRAANGILQILLEKKIHLDLLQLLEQAKKAYTSHLPNLEVTAQVFDFMLHRLKSICLEKGFSTQQFDAVFAKKPTNVVNFMQRLEAVQKFQQLPESAALAAADKRVRNILRKQSQDLSHFSIDAHLFEHEAEKKLAAELAIQKKKITDLYQSGHYVEALAVLAALKCSIDLFFDKVMVMCEDPAKRQNRLTLLHYLHELFVQIADISLLA